MAALNSQKFFAHLDTGGQPAGAYLLAGEEGFLLNRALGRLVEKAIAGAPRDFNLDVFYARDSKAEEIAAQCQTLPMMADRRVVVLHEADRLKEAEPLKLYLKDPSPTTTLIMVAESSEKAREMTLSRMLGKADVHAHFYRPTDSELGYWIGSLAREAGYKLAPDAVSYLKDVLGDNIALIDSELKKLFNFAGEKKSISMQDVRESVGDFGLPLVFDLVDQVADGKPGKAIDTMSRLMREGEQPLMVLGMLSRHWRRLVEARQMMERGDGPKELERHFRLNFRNKDRFIGQVKRLDKAALRSAFMHLSSADESLKGSRMPPRLAMERLVLELTGVWRA